MPARCRFSESSVAKIDYSYLRSSLVFCLALKLLNVDDEPLVSAFADKSALIERLYREADLSAVYLYDLGFGPYLHSNGGLRRSDLR